MSTNPQRVHLSTNPTNTAVLIAASKDRTPDWAVVTRGSAAALIDSHHARHDRLHPLTRSDALLLIPLASIALAATLYLYLNGATAIWGLPLILFGGLFALTRFPKPLPLELDRQIAAITSQDEVLIACPVPIALELTEAQHSALRVAADYDVVDEVLTTLVERHDARLEAERARRRELAEEIVNDHTTKGSRQAESTGS